MIDYFKFRCQFFTTVMIDCFKPFWQLYRIIIWFIYFKFCLHSCTSVIWSIISRHVEYVQVLYDRLFQDMLSMYKCCMIDYFKACWVCTSVVWSIISRHVEYVHVLYDRLFQDMLSMYKCYMIDCLNLDWYKVLFLYESWIDWGFLIMCM